MKEIPSVPPLPNVPPAQDFILRLADQVVPHTVSWRPFATAINYLVCIAPIVYMAFQARPASPLGVQLDSGMGCDMDLLSSIGLLDFYCFPKFSKVIDNL
ncbi:hypothetical protein DSO57_1034636 [Entomophthora muscae]|uniref:Uncharacterized protein n=1 Tax=Entomophthora muscae TaxID=34485 RepID=A0ACC2S1W8_9FUNG|nr:hypothetical protein DSO57_1034636 [Entomophthora muscae]